MQSQTLVFATQFLTNLLRHVRKVLALMQGYGFIAYMMLTRKAVHALSDIQQVNDSGKISKHPQPWSLFTHADYRDC